MTKKYKIKTIKITQKIKNLNQKKKTKKYYMLLKTFKQNCA